MSWTVIIIIIIFLLHSGLKLCSHNHRFTPSVLSSMWPGILNILSENGLGVTGFLLAVDVSVLRLSKGGHAQLWCQGGQGLVGLFLFSCCAKISWQNQLKEERVWAHSSRRLEPIVTGKAWCRSRWLADCVSSKLRNTGRTAKGPKPCPSDVLPPARLFFLLKVP